MADLGSFFDPTAIAQAVTPNTDELRNRWDMYLNSPETQAALLSFGAQAAQPRQWGQSGFGHLLSSVAQGGQGVRNVQEEDRKTQEADSKTQLRESQALLAETRAGTATANANTAGSRLELARLREEGLNSRNLLGRQIQANRIYNDYVKQTQKANQNASLFGKPSQPVLGFEEWVGQNPTLLQNLGLTPGMLQQAPGGTGPTDSGVAPGVSPAPSTGTSGATYPQPTPRALEALRANPQRRSEFDAKYGPGAAARALGAPSAGGGGGF